ncbi:hypothetical protein F0562_011760 [Nyssa sinensis]|uniref:Uncharacterized protein n=1 Tax=Nyssa sinensis TaxID=561372 RepID=A0A5J4ZVD4_9ASTE|nr:hypothetical protein F0562_011760 [Nyssa sinensis]
MLLENKFKEKLFLVIVRLKKKFNGDIIPGDGVPSEQVDLAGVSAKPTVIDDMLDPPTESATRASLIISPIFEPFPKLRTTFYETLGDTVLALDRREIQSFQVVEVNTLLKALPSLSSNGLNVDWLRAYMEHLIEFFNHHIDYEADETLKKEITTLSLKLESIQQFLLKLKSRSARLWAKLKLDHSQIGRKKGSLRLFD